MTFLPALRASSSRYVTGGLFSRLPPPALVSVTKVARDFSCSPKALSSGGFKVLPGEALADCEGKADYSECLERSAFSESEYGRLRSVCESGGGEKGALRHVQKNKKVLVRDRLRGILDQDQKALMELSVTAGMGMEYGDVPCAGTVAVIGSIRDTKCLILANDATVKGGTSYPITVTKSLRAQQIAAENGLPCVYLVDSGGAFLPLQSEIFPDAKHGGRSFANQAIMSAAGIPQVSLVAGMCTAGGAYTPTMAVEHIMVHKIANVYLGGPPLVKAALGESISGEALGGATLHCTTSGVADHFAQSEAESFDILRDVISSLNLPPKNESSENRFNEEEPVCDPKELDYYGGKPDQLSKSEVSQVLARVLDGSKFQEFKARFGPNLTCGFGRLRGQMVGVVANSGMLNAAEGQKGAHFVQVCDSRDVPIIFLQNSGKSKDVEAEKAGYSLALKERGKMAQCIANSRVPKITLNLTGAIGDDNYALCGPSFGARFYLMWPRSVLRKSIQMPEEKEITTAGGSPPGVAAAAAATSKKPRPKLSEYEFSPDSAQYAASRLTSDGIVLPSQTRRVLSKLVEIVMANHVPIRTVNTVRQAAGLPLVHAYGAMRF